MLAITGEKMAAPRAATNELGGECNGCQARGEGGNKKNNSGDVLGEGRDREGDGDGDTRGKTNRGDGDVHE